MNVVTPDPTLGPADSPADHDQLSSGWSLGTAFSDAWQQSGMSSLLRGSDQYEQRFGQSTRAGTYMFRPGTETPVLDPEEANRDYGIPGELTWDKPIHEGEAKLLNQWKREEIRRRDTLARSTAGILPATARFLAGAGATMLDPINLAANTVPVLGEARWARAAGVFGERATRIIRGGVEGLVGSAAVEPITYVQAQNQQADYDAYDALTNIAFGAVAGAGMHAIGEAVGAYRDWRRTPQATREAALNQAVAAVAEQAPVRAAEITAQPINIVSDYLNDNPGGIDPVRIATETGLEPEEVQRSLSALATHGSLEYSARTGKFRRTAQTGPLDAISFLQSKGGIADNEGHNLLTGRDAQRSNPRYGALIRKSGMSVDEAGELLHEAGYFGDPAETPRPSEAEVLDLLDRAFTGEKIYSVRDVGHALDQADQRIQATDLAENELERVIDERRLNVSTEEKAAALHDVMTNGIDPGDALDSVLERSAVEGGVFLSPVERLTAIERQINRVRKAGGDVVSLAGLMDERAAIEADIAGAQSREMAATGNAPEIIRQDLTGEAGGSAEASADAASRVADFEAAQSPRIAARLQAAQEAADQAEAKYRALRGQAVAAPEPPEFEAEPPRRRKRGIPEQAARPITSHWNAKTLRAHPDFQAGKGGDPAAAIRVVGDVVKPATIDEARERFGSGAIFVPVVAEERAGRNQIPVALAQFYAEATDGRSAAGDIVQTNRVFHTDASAASRLVSRALFDGPVEAGGRYVLVDDVTVSGGTLAELADHIQANGGEVIGIVSLVNGSRRADYRVSAEQLAALKSRFGDEIDKLGISPEALTGTEADYILRFRDADSLRNRISAAVGERNQRPGGKGLRTSEAEEGLSEPGPNDFTDEEEEALASDLAELDRIKAQRKAAADLASCMVREGV
jgi:hypothetical protein